MVYVCPGIQSEAAFGSITMMDDDDGAGLGFAEGSGVGAVVGVADGLGEGPKLGFGVGAGVGCNEGPGLGEGVGMDVGNGVGGSVVEIVNSAEYPSWPVA